MRLGIKCTAAWVAPFTALLLIQSVVEMRAATPSSTRSLAAVRKVEPHLTKALEKHDLHLGSPVFIRIFKEAAVLELWVQKEERFRLLKMYPICAFSGGLGPKLKEGDGQAPEGCYSVAADRMNPNSQFHLSFNLGYPNAFDRHHRRTGSAIMVHGDCVSVGCYAMGDEAIEEIWTLCSKALDGGQTSFQVHCFPFPLTSANIEAHRTNTWSEFWRSLKPIYDCFETNQIPPKVVIKDGNYGIAAGTGSE